MFNTIPLHLHKNVKFLRILKKILLWLLWLGLYFSFGNIISLHAQNPVSPTPTEQTQYRMDSVRLSPKDSLRIAKQDSINKKKDIETSINYHSEDSIVYDAKNKKIKLYRNASANYGAIKLDAERLDIDQRNNEITAYGVRDSSGVIIGMPKFKNANEEMEAEDIKYNIKSKRGLIRKVVTKQGDGFIQGKIVKKDEEGNLYLGKGMYTTCNLAHPHFYIQANKIKMVSNKQIVVGPFNFHLADIPTPIGFIFGIFPLNTQTRKSGIIIPTYGEEPAGRGFYLRQGGYFWAANQYTNVAFTGEIYSKGGWGLNIASQYTVKYHYSGTLNLSYNRRLTGDEGQRTAIQDFWIRWSHTPQSRGSSRFSASVNAGTNGNNIRNNLTDPTQRVSASFNSNISYSKIFTGTPFSTAITLRHDMNVATRVMNMSLPDFSLNMNRIYPLNFNSITSSGPKWWQTLSVGYSLRGTNQLTNLNTLSGSGLPFVASKGDYLTDPRSLTRTDTLSFIKNFPTILDRAQFGAVNSVPISLTLRLLKFFSVSPSFSYSETWYLKRLNYIRDAKTGGIKIDTINKFSRFYNYSTSLGITTRIFGTYQLGGRRVEAIRHTLIPSISLSYAPDFSNPKYDFYQNVQVNGSYTGGSDLNKYDEKSISRYSGFFLGGPSSGRSGSLSFSLNNTLEMKVKAKADTSQSSSSKKSKFTKVSILDAFGISSGYNFLAKQYKLSPFNFNATTRLFNNKLNVSLFGSLDPYKYILDSTGRGGVIYQRKIDKYAWASNSTITEGTGQAISHKGIGELSNITFSLSTNLNPKASKSKVNPAAQKAANSTNPAVQSELAAIKANPNNYVDWNIPWSLNVSYNFNYSKIGFQNSQLTQVANFNGNLSLTQKFKIGFTTGYDIQHGQLSYTSLNINRDLHCWDMLISWIPFGTFTSYSFTIRAKSTLLQDLKITRQRNFYDH